MFHNLYLRTQKESKRRFSIPQFMGPTLHKINLKEVVKRAISSFLKPNEYILVYSYFTNLNSE